MNFTCLWRVCLCENRLFSRLSSRVLCQPPQQTEPLTPTPSPPSPLSPRHNGLHGRQVCPPRLQLGRRQEAVGWRSPAAAALLRPGHPEGGHRGGRLSLVRLGRPLAHAQQCLQLYPEVLIEPAVDEGVVAGTAHGKPVEGKVEGVVGADNLAGEQEDVAVEGEPAEGKKDHHQHQHLNGLLLLAPQGQVLLRGHVADGVAQPQLLGHTGVGHRDDEEGENVKQDESGQVQVLPEEISWLREVWQAQGADDVLTGDRGERRRLCSYCGKAPSQEHWPLSSLGSWYIHPFKHRWWAAWLYDYIFSIPTRLGVL